MKAAPGYWVWLVGAAGSELGSTVMVFAVAWTATGFGGAAAGLVTTVVMLSRTVLLLAGGTVGDRFGPRRVMLACDATMLVVTAALALWFGLHGPSLAALVVVGFALGVVSAFYFPASGVFPRLFVEDAELSRLMATTGSVLQLARIAGPAIGGFLLVAVGLSWVVAINAASFALIFGVVLFVVPPRPARPPDSAPVGFRDAWTDVRQAGQHRVLASLLTALAALVAGVQPGLLLLFPLLCRGNGWGSGSAGLLEAGVNVAALAVGAVVMTRGTLARAALALVGGPVLAAAGLLGVALAPAVWVACVAAVAVGFGLVSFNVHAMPRFLAASPAHAQVRLQAVLGLATTLPVLALSGLFGTLAQHTSPSWALAVASLCALGAAAVMATNGPRLPVGQRREESEPKASTDGGTGIPARRSGAGSGTA